MASESASRAFMSDAKELVDAGQFSKAIAILQEGLKKFPKMVSARVLLGEIYRTSGDLALARVELEQVIKAAPDNFAAYRRLAFVYRDLEDKPAALKACETILKANPKDREMGQLRDQLQSGKGGKAKAGDKAAISKKGKRSEKREATKMEEAIKEVPATMPTVEFPVVDYAAPSPVAEHVASETAGGGHSLPMEGAGDVTDTEMLAELYISQGHPEKGLEVFRRLAAREPDNLRFHEKIQRLVEGGVGVSHAPTKGYPEIPEHPKRPERREAAKTEETVKEVPATISTEQSPVAEHIASESAGAGRSLPMEGAGDIADSEMLAELYISQGHSEKGLEVFRRLAAREPDNLRLHEKIQRLVEGGVGVSHAPTKGYPEFSDHAKRVESSGGVNDSEMLAELYISQGEPEKGLEVYRRIAAKDPDNVRLHEKIIALEVEGAGASHRAPAKASPETSDQTKRKARIRRLEGWLARIRERRRT
jgi:tetratricopeptide (TPR) repeat protein